MNAYTDMICGAPDDVLVLGMHYDETRALELWEIAKEIVDTHDAVRAVQFSGDTLCPTLITITDYLDESKGEWNYTSEGWRVGMLTLDKWRQADLEFYHKNSDETFHVLFNMPEQD